MLLPSCSSEAVFFLFFITQWFHLQTSAKYVDDGSSPEFTSRITNISVPIGRDAIFTCNVKSLGSFKIGWVKADSKAIQAIQNAVITHNARVQVSGDLQTTFNLHLASVKEEDRGQYMCQINTDPMIYQTATLDVMVPPDITQSSPDQELRQGETAKLECRADGYPGPKISWRREEEGSHIKAMDKNGGVKKFRRFEGTSLSIPNVIPEDMGAYLCIATNDVPPARSKRVFLYVQFAPTIQAKEQMVGFAFGKETSLSCIVNAYPKPFVYWNYTEGVIHPGGKFEVSESQLSPSQMSSTLTIKSPTAEEMGKFECVAKNSIGVSQAMIRTYLVATPPPPPLRSVTSSASSSAASFPTFPRDLDEEKELLNFDTSDKKDVNPEWTSNNELYSSPIGNKNQYEIVEGVGEEKDSRRRKSKEFSISNASQFFVNVPISVIMLLLKLCFIHVCF